MYEIIDINKLQTKKPEFPLPYRSYSDPLARILRSQIQKFKGTVPLQKCESGEEMVDGWRLRPVEGYDLDFDGVGCA